MVNIFDIYKGQGELSTILVYPAITLADDPYEKTTSTSYLNPLPIKGIVSDSSFESLRWKYYGTLPAGSKKMICEKKYSSLLLTCNKITIDGNDYAVYKDSDKNFQILTRKDYLLVILSRI